MNSLQIRNKKVALNRWKNVRINRRSHINSTPSKYLKFKAALLGYLIGDGSVSHTVDVNSIHHFSIRFYPDNLNMAHTYIRYFKLVYGIDLRIRNERNHYSIQVKDKIIYQDLSSLASFGSLNWRIPNDFLTSDIMRKEFLKAFFDCEAYVGKNVIQVQSVNKIGLLQIKEMLLAFQINSKIYSYKRKQKNWNDNYILCIMRRSERQKYLKTIGFNHSEKLQKLRADIA